MTRHVEKTIAEPCAHFLGFVLLADGMSAPILQGTSHDFKDEDVIMSVAFPYCPWCGSENPSEEACH